MYSNQLSFKNIETYGIYASSGNLYNCSYPYSQLITIKADSVTIPGLYQYSNLHGDRQFVTMPMNGRILGISVYSSHDIYTNGSTNGYFRAYPIIGGNYSQSQRDNGLYISETISTYPRRRFWKILSSGDLQFSPLTPISIKYETDVPTYAPSGTVLTGTLIIE